MQTNTTESRKLGTSVAVIDGARTGFTRIGTKQKYLSAIDLGVRPVNALCERYGLGTKTDGLLIFGTVIQHTEVSNLAREIALVSKLHPMTRCFSTVKACATSLNATAEAAAWIANGSVPWALVGGSESMSNFPVHFSKRVGATLRDFKFSRSTGEKLSALMGLRPADLLPQVPGVTELSTGLSMGQHCEIMLRDWSIPREEQDQWAAQSHHAAAAAAQWNEKFIIHETDNLVRADTSAEKLAKLKPVFPLPPHLIEKYPGAGTLTAGNSSPLTDGGACVLLADEAYARKQRWPILAIIDDFEAAAVDIKSEGLLMAPPYAILRLLDRKGLQLTDFDMVEIHEAFAGQVLCNLKAITDSKWAQSRVGLPATTLPSRDRLNPKGGSVSVGHPFGATGARLVMQLARSMQESKAKRGLISICAAGGLGLVGTLRSSERS